MCLLFRHQETGFSAGGQWKENGGRVGILAESATAKRPGGPCSATTSRCLLEWGHFVRQEI